MFPMSSLAPLKMHLFVFCCGWGSFFLFPNVTGQKSAGLTIIAVDFSEYPEPFQ